MKTQRDAGYYGTIDYKDTNGQHNTYSMYKDSRGSLYKTQKPLMNRLKKQVEWMLSYNREVVKVSILEAVVNEEVLVTTEIQPDDLK